MKNKDLGLYIETFVLTTIIPLLGLVFFDKWIDKKEKL